MKMNITRRTLLRGVGGVALGLPLLECMMGRSVAASPVEIPKRFLALYVGHGFSLTDDWNFFPSVVDGKMNFSKSMDGQKPFARPDRGGDPWKEDALSQSGAWQRRRDGWQRQLENLVV